ncbi:MAG: hypothetical protein EA397_02055 [Deltaproteobacteria bacterium]|nr:MAG: hypothetical protein EA397_02055 [Deltaproteobacteria bacterium]
MIAPPWGPALAVTLVMIGWGVVLGLAQRGGSGRWVAVGVAVALALSMVGWHVDDAGIVYAYARALAEGRGLSPGPGLAPVEGFSDPLWVASLTPFVAVGAPAPLAAKVLQLGLGAAVVWGSHRLALRTGASALGADVTAMMVAGSGVLAVWSASGLEVALFAWLLLVAAGAAHGDPRTRAEAGVSPWFEGGVVTVAVALLCWSRPEGGLAGWAVAAILGMLAARRWVVGPATVGLVLGTVSLFGLRWWLLGELWPNTALAKLPAYDLWTLLRGGAYLGGAALMTGFLPLLLGAMPAGLGRGRRTVFGAVGIASMAAVFVLIAGGDWMLHARLLAPYVPVVFALAVPEVVTTIRRRTRGSTGASVLLVLAALCGGITLADAVARPTLPMDLGLRKGELFDAITGDACPESTVATPDAGGVLYGSPTLELTDLAGLLDAEAARHRRHPGYWPARMQVQRPALIDLHDGWAHRTGLSDEVLTELGYAILCRRWPAPEAPTLWLHHRCDAPRRAQTQARIDLFCAEGLRGLEPLP